MIKYKIKTGAKELNEKARAYRDIYKKELNGMHCRKCKTDTIIEFVKSDSNYVKTFIHSCCSEFDKRIKDKLWPNKD
jgi:hypothetical protein